MESPPPLGRLPSPKEAKQPARKAELSTSRPSRQKMATVSGESQIPIGNLAVQAQKRCGQRHVIRTGLGRPWESSFHQSQWLSFDC